MELLTKTSSYYQSDIYLEGATVAIRKRKTEAVDEPVEEVAGELVPEADPTFRRLQEINDMVPDHVREALAQTVAPGWRGDIGDAIYGRITKLEMRASKDPKWGDYPMLTLELPDGSMHTVHAFHGVLKSELIRYRPEVGESVAIVRGPRIERTNEDGSDGAYHMYAVCMPDREESKVKPFSWDDVV